MVKGLGSKITWKRKKWYNIHAPAFLGEALIGQTPGVEAAQVKERTVKINASNLLNDFKKQNYTVILKINKVTGGKADTIINSFSTDKSQIRRMIRKGGSRIDVNENYETKNKTKLNIKTMLFTTTKCEAKKKKEIRNKAHEYLKKIIEQRTSEELFTEIMSTKLQKTMKQEINKTHPVRIIEIIKFTNIK